MIASLFPRLTTRAERVLELQEDADEMEADREDALLRLTAERDQLRDRLDAAIDGHAAALAALQDLCAAVTFQADTGCADPAALREAVSRAHVGVAP